MILNAPIVEEIIFRKIIFGSLVSKSNFFISAFISSILFAALHNDWQGFLLYFVIGVVFCYIYYKSSSIIPTLIGHLILNFIFIINVSNHI
ncbi:CPBP family intramembrane glutamic endopeptidase [Paenibacillus hexagrammi]|uniref:CPBP family intramembrane glutamic endopeptidase n=1 Tax=Paenibacillus hexagrammi TaxID=2908839 RepID=UPI003312FE5E